MTTPPVDPRPALATGQTDVPSLLARASGSDFTAYDPRAVIEAVNALVAVGPEAAWAAIDGVLASADLAAEPHHGLMLVLRVAFDAELHPPLRIGSSDPLPPTDPGAVPRFPIVIVDDVPLLLVARYAASDVTEPISIHVAHYRASGTLRAKPMAPGDDADRLAGVVAVYRAAYDVEPSDGVRAFVVEQLRRGGFPIKGP